MQRAIYFGPKPIVVILDDDGEIMTPMEIVKEFVHRVNVRAEGNMELTGKVEGAHYNAMQIELRFFEETIGDG